MVMARVRTRTSPSPPVGRSDRTSAKALSLKAPAGSDATSICRFSVTAAPPRRERSAWHRPPPSVGPARGHGDVPDGVLMRLQPVLGVGALGHDREVLLASQLEGALHQHAAEA